jgi:AcrR family transcriptional regulator
LTLSPVRVKIRETNRSVRQQRGNVEKRSVITVRFASGAVEYWYESAVPKVGDRVGREASGFVTSVELEGDDHATAYVGTPAPDFVRWDDLAPSDVALRRPATARERILEAAYELFSQRGIRAVGTEEVVERAGVARSTLYRHFRSKEDLVLAFLQRREQRWTREFVEAEARRRGDTPREQLLAIFDVFDEWFHRDDFEGCSFINVLLEIGDLHEPVGSASAAHLEYIRSVVRRIAEEAGVDGAEEFSESWHILMKGSIVTAGEGDVLAARRARAMGERLLDEHLPYAASDAPSNEDLIARAAT